MTRRSLLLSLIALCGVFAPAALPAQDSAPLERLPPAAAELSLENIAGGKRALSEFKDKVALLMVVGRYSRDASAKISNEIALALADQPDFARLGLGDLKGAPGFLRGPIRDGIKDGNRKSEEKLAKEFQARNIAFEERHKATILLDWKGDFAKFLNVSGKTERTYQAFVLDREGRILLHLTQPNKKEDATLNAQRDQLLEALKKALSASK